MIRTIRRLAVAAGMVGALLPVFAMTGSAQAVPAASAPSASAPTSTSPHDTGAAPAALSDCHATNFCFWVNAGYNDGPGQLSGDNTDWRAFGHASCQTHNWSDCASSGFNDGTSGLGVEVWQNINYGGASACLPRLWRLNNFAGFVYPGTSVSFNDSISSNFWTSNC